MFEEQLYVMCVSMCRTYF